MWIIGRFTVCVWEGGGRGGGKRSCGKVMFPQAYVKNSVRGRGVSRPRPRGCVSQHALRQTPPQADGYCCRRYASYWNAFLLTAKFTYVKKLNLIESIKSCLTSILRSKETNVRLELVVVLKTTTYTRVWFVPSTRSCRNAYELKFQDVTKTVAASWVEPAYW